MHTDLLTKAPALYDAGTDLVWAQQKNLPEFEILIRLNRLECLLHEYYGLLKSANLLETGHELEFNYKSWLQVAYAQRWQFLQAEQVAYLNAAKPPPRHLYN